MTVDLELNDQGVITDLRWIGGGCAISQATASLLAEQAIGRSLAQLQQLDIPQLVEVLGVPLSPARYKCALLFVQCLRQIEVAK
jgi:nitrogen fixation NifU-like protein